MISLFILLSVYVVIFYVHTQRVLDVVTPSSPKLLKLYDKWAYSSINTLRWLVVSIMSIYFVVPSALAYWLTDDLETYSIICTCIALLVGAGLSFNATLKFYSFVALVQALLYIAYL